jgi:alkane 1-monooxygenase
VQKSVSTTFYSYLPSYLFGLIALWSTLQGGWSYYSLLLFSFGVIPLLELFLPVNKSYLQVKNHLLNRILVVLIVPFHIFLVWKYLEIFSTGNLKPYETVGAVSTLGILCGVYGINVAHELGHRNHKGYQLLAQLLLSTSLYMHFFIEHNRGHHKRVATLEDPATARKNETVYQFWVRCISQSFKSAFNLEKERLKRLNKEWYSPDNQFLLFIYIQFIIVLSIALYWEPVVATLFVCSAAIGILLLETINYIEHYGLLRKELAPGVYERVNETHSWNSDHILGRYLLFELSRHSHHHENSSRPYEDLQSMPKSNQLPTGYPGMMLLSLIPPAFFNIMNRRIN